PVGFGQLALFLQPLDGFHQPLDRFLFRDWLRLLAAPARGRFLFFRSRRPGLARIRIGSILSRRHAGTQQPQAGNGKDVGKVKTIMAARHEAPPRGARDAPFPLPLSDYTEPGSFARTIRREVNKRPAAAVMLAGAPRQRPP